MNIKRNFVFLTLLVTAFVLAGCYRSQNPVEPVQNSANPIAHKLSIPVGALLDSAELYINVTTAGDEQVTLHGITNYWEENSVTWNNFSGSYNPVSDADFTPDAAGWYRVDVTSLVSNWLDSTLANNGILLKEETPAQMQFYSSKEGGNGPYLKIFWTFNGTTGYDSSGASEDAFIYSGEGDINYGDSTNLITGWQDTTEYQTLVKFEIEQTPVQMGCTRSFGYWKTHSVYGPAPYDSVWAMLGEDSTFFLSEKSNYMVMWTAPKHGNTYYLLAHQYITAELNFLHGADPSDLQEAFNDATALFETYTPDEIEVLHGNDPLRQQFISLKNIFDEYNGGMIGPGSCEDMSLRSVAKLY